MKSAATAPLFLGGDDDFCPRAEVIFFLPGTLPQGGTAMQDYEEIIRQKGLPDVGQTLLHKKYGTLWRIIEKREVWQNIADDPRTKQPRMVPAIYLCYWRLQEGVPPGVGIMMGYTYTLLDNTFEANWEILPDYPYGWYSEGWLGVEPGAAEVIELPRTPPRHEASLEKNRHAEYKEEQEGPGAGGKVIPLRQTKKALYRAATKEIQKIYQLSHGGLDPIIDEASREAFERGEIEEVRWKDWATFLLNGLPPR
jgi:hypothetical protein